MKTKRFTLTYSIVTEASCEHGEPAYNGYVTRDGGTPRKRNSIPKNPAQFSLRDALSILEDQQCELHVECDSCPWSPASPPRWISFQSGWNDDQETLELSLHPAKRDGISAASMCRIARLFGAYGERKPAALTH